MIADRRSGLKGPRIDDQAITDFFLCLRAIPRRHVGDMLTTPSEPRTDNEPASASDAPGIGSFPAGQDIGRLLHNLRNPLTPLMMGIEILKAGQLDEQQQQLLDMMHGQVRQLTGIIDDFESAAAPPPPEAQDQSPSAGKQDLTANGASGVRSVLIIDDNPNILASLKILFEERGYDVLAAMRAEDAVALAGAHQPTVCLCDISLPTIDGFEAASELRTAHGGMLMFSMSGFDSREDRERSNAVGFLDHFRKPFAFDEVLQIIENYAAVRSFG